MIGRLIDVMDQSDAIRCVDPLNLISSIYYLTSCIQKRYTSIIVMLVQPMYSLDTEDGTSCTPTSFMYLSGFIF